MVEPRHRTIVLDGILGYPARQWCFTFAWVVAPLPAPTADSRSIGRRRGKQNEGSTGTTRGSQPTPGKLSRQSIATRRSGTRSWENIAPAWSCVSPTDMAPGLETPRDPLPLTSFWTRFRGFCTICATSCSFSPDAGAWFGRAWTRVCAAGAGTSRSLPIFGLSTHGQYS